MVWVMLSTKGPVSSRGGEKCEFAPLNTCLHVAQLCHKIMAEHHARLSLFHVLAPERLNILANFTGIFPSSIIPGVGKDWIRSIMNNLRLLQHFN